jgi:hypothetical protein
MAPIQFKWWVFLNGVWSVAQGWSTSNKFTWTPPAGGNYFIGVWARSNGNTADAPEGSAFASVEFRATPPPPLSILSLLPDKAAPQQLGITVNFTAITTGGMAPIQLKWWLFNGVTWTVIGDWSTSNTFSWTSTNKGDYIIGVWARSNGSNLDYPENDAFRGISFTIESSSAAFFVDPLGDGNR